MKRPTAPIDVAPIRFTKDRANIGSFAAEQLRRQPVSGSIAAIGDDLQSNEGTLRRREQILDITLVQALIHIQPERLRLYTVLEQAEDLLFHCVLFGIRQLEAGMAEHFDAVVLIRIVRRRNHHARDELIRARQVRDAGGCNHSSEPRSYAAPLETSCDLLRDP